MSVQPDSIEFARHDVTAVLVTHDGERWVGQVLDAIAGQERPIQRFVAVDTGSRDRTVEILYDTVGEGRVIKRSRDTGFGRAAGFAVNAVFGGGTAPAVRGEPDEPVEWIWLLHDDCEPDPSALGYLLALADEDPEIGVVGPKVRGWYNRRDLLEVGTTIAPNGRRETGLDRGETDQGQHDGQREVLAVGSAGMLVRRDVWETLGGFDRALAMMRDDQDFCWRVNMAGWRVMINTDAVVYHAEAAARERRKISARVGRAHFLDRAHALFVLLANVPLRRLPLTMLRVGFSTMGRAIGYTLAKLPDYAIDEALSLLYVIGRIPAILRARMVRRRYRRVKSKELRDLFPPRWSQLRHMVDSIAERLQRSQVDVDPTTGKHGAAVESGPVGEETEDLETNDLSVIGRFIRQPMVVLGVALLAVTVLACRELIGAGQLMGGALLPAPSDWHRIWDNYFASWHAVGVGSGTTAPPYLAVIGSLGPVLGGDAGRAVNLLVLGCVPLAGLTAYLAVRKVVASRLVRIWASAAYALLPAVTGAVAAGRLGTAVGTVLLPLAGLGAVRALGLDGRAASWRAAWVTGLVLAVMTAFVPAAWLLAIVLGFVAVLMRIRRIGSLARLAVILITPALLLVPWSIDLLRQPSLVFLEVGLPGPELSDPNVSPLALLLLHPGGPGMYPMWITLGILLVALVALLRTDRRRIVVAGWTIVVSGLAVAVVMSRTEVTGPTQAEAVPAWPGFATVVMGAGMLLAALIGAEGARERLARSSFGWRQPLGLVMSVLAIVTPALAALWWVAGGANGPLERRDPVVLPAYVAAEGQSTDRPRTLVLQKRNAGLLSYTLLRDVGPRIGDAETAPPREQYAGLDQVVSEVIGGTGDGEEAAKLAEYAIRYVLVTRPVDPELIKSLDAVPGLDRISATDGGALWRLGVRSARLRILSAEGKPLQTVPSGAIAASAVIDPGDDGRLLVLAETADPGWRATLNGEQLTARTSGDWAQAFELPANGGQLELAHVSQSRTYWLLAELTLLVFVIILALPGGRRRTVEEDYEDFGPLPERIRRPMPGTDPADYGYGPHDVPEPVPVGPVGYPMDEPLRRELEPRPAGFDPAREDFEPGFEPRRRELEPAEYAPVGAEFEPGPDELRPAPAELEDRRFEEAPFEPVGLEPAGFEASYAEPAGPTTGGDRIGHRTGVGAAVAGVAAARAVTSGQIPVVGSPPPEPAPHHDGSMGLVPPEPGSGHQPPAVHEPAPVHEPAAPQLYAPGPATDEPRAAHAYGSSGYEQASHGPAGYDRGAQEPAQHRSRHGRHAGGSYEAYEYPRWPVGSDNSAGEDGQQGPGPVQPVPRHAGRPSAREPDYDQRPDPLAYDPTYDPAFTIGPMPALPLASYEVLHDEPYPAGAAPEHDDQGYPTLPEYGGFDPLPNGAHPDGGDPEGTAPRIPAQDTAAQSDAQPRVRRLPWEVGEDEPGNDDWRGRSL
ncbi:MAG: glycosyltransferase [Actinomycetes bacterium]